MVADARAAMVEGAMAVAVALAIVEGAVAVAVALAMVEGEVVAALAMVEGAVAVALAIVDGGVEEVEKEVVSSQASDLPMEESLAEMMRARCLLSWMNQSQQLVVESVRALPNSG